MMKTNNHTRGKEYRNLYRAKPVKGNSEMTLSLWEWTTQRMVRKAHAAFWERRGITPPPEVCVKTLGAFKLPDGRMNDEC